MSPHPRMHWSAVVGTLVVGLLAGGCGSALLSSDGTGSLLDLTDEQRQAAEEIRQAEREDVEALWAAADEDVRALLTEEQLAIYDELPRLMPGGGHGPPSVQAAGPRDPLPDFLAEKLGLSEEQQTAVEEVLTTLRAATEARRKEAREAFLALLTDEQREQLEQRLGNGPAH